jgi:hypothetical protein
MLILVDYVAMIREIDLLLPEVVSLLGNALDVIRNLWH